MGSRWGELLSEFHAELNRCSREAQTKRIFDSRDEFYLRLNAEIAERNRQVNACWAE